MAQPNQPTPERAAQGAGKSIPIEDDRPADAKAQPQAQPADASGSKETPLPTLPPRKRRRKARRSRPRSSKTPALRLTSRCSGQGGGPGLAGQVPAPARRVGHVSPPHHRAARGREGARDGEAGHQPAARHRRLRAHHRLRDEERRRRPVRRRKGRACEARRRAEEGRRRGHRPGRRSVRRAGSASGGHGGRCQRARRDGVRGIPTRLQDGNESSQACNGNRHLRRSQTGETAGRRGKVKANDQSGQGQEAARFWFTR